MATKGTRWMVDRTQDLLPYLFNMMVAEWWYGLRGRAERLDATIEEQTKAALITEAEPSRLTAWLAPMDVPLTNCDR